MKTFYVCSYGGCGSSLLFSFLGQYGRVHHIHSRKPPNKLQYVENVWFNGKNVPDEELKDCYVIYIHKNITHLVHVKTDPNTLVEDVVATETYLYGLKELYANYTTKKHKPKPPYLLC